MEVPGIHHVTAICGDPQRNVDFYAGILGLRLVKKTVNFDDPTAYHLYYGDEVGTPGTILTFFAWPGARAGRAGVGQVSTTSFSVPEPSIARWAGHLRQSGVTVTGPDRRLGETFIGFEDPDGLQLELIGIAEEPDHAAAGRPWAQGPLGTEHAIRRIRGVTLVEQGYEGTAALLTDVMGLRTAGNEDSRFRYVTAEAGRQASVDLLSQPEGAHGAVAVGTVHHVAFRSLDDEEQRRWRELLVARGLDVTPVIDRQYFHSIYFREPGGVLFEIATDPPGFLRDEPLEKLGQALELPPWLESFREQLGRALPPITVP
ncbi:MAG: ring-cleaving dioxygenase [Candidatus Dormibacteraeota bacterium]|nr:ring-cleaving dioxygenase [Candidatus Dormibacteraeota bacterium]